MSLSRYSTDVRRRVPHLVQQALLVCAALATLTFLALTATKALQRDGGFVKADPVANNGHAAGSGALLAPEARLAQQVDVIYSVPPVDAGIADGSVYYRQIDGLTLAASGADELLGRFTGVGQLSNNSVDPGIREILVSQDVTGSTRRTAIDDGRLNSIGEGYDSAMPVGVVGSDGAVYFAEGSQVVGTDGAGRTLAVSLPVPEAGIPMLDGKPTKQITSPSASRAAALVIAPTGDLLVFVDNSVNSAVVDITNGARLDLPGYGYVEAAVVGLDGNVHALLWDPSHTGNSFVLARIDPKTMTLLGSVDTGIGPSQGAIDGVGLSVGLDGTVYIYVARESAGSITQHPILLKLDTASDSPSKISLPDNAGLSFTVGVDGRLYFFGGLAGPTVTVFDPTSGSIDSFKAAPEGSYVRAVFVR